MINPAYYIWYIQEYFYLGNGWDFRPYCLGITAFENPERFICFPGQLSIVLAILGIYFWYVCIKMMLTGENILLHAQRGRE